MIRRLWILTYFISKWLKLFIVLVIFKLTFCTFNEYFFVFDIFITVLAFYEVVSINTIDHLKVITHTLFIKLTLWALACRFIKNHVFFYIFNLVFILCLKRMLIFNLYDWMTWFLRFRFFCLKLFEISEKGLFVTLKLRCVWFSSQYLIRSILFTIDLLYTFQIRRFLNLARSPNNIIIFNPNLLILFLVRFNQILVFLFLDHFFTLLCNYRLLWWATLLWN